MSTDYDNTIRTIQPGVLAPADGNAGSAVAQAFRLEDFALDGANPARQGKGLTPEGVSYTDGHESAALGPNNERLEDLKPRLVNALRELVRQYREEGVSARRHEIRRIRQARLFWQGLQYAWWNPNDMNWHLPFEQRFNDDRQLEDMPRYQFVTNFYQGFGLSFIAVLSQDVPSVRFYPQSAQSLQDIAAARSASDVAQLIEQNNHVEHLLTSIGYFLWTDGKLGAYVRYVADGQRFGFHDENILEAVEIPLGEDAYVCPRCNKEVPPPNADQASGDTDEGSDTGHQSPITSHPSCPGCGAELSHENLRRAERVSVPRFVGTRRVPNGQEVISIAGGLELNTPVWANEMHEYPYLQWQAEVHRAKLKAAYPHAANKIETSPSQGAEDVYARVSRLSVEQGLPSIHPGDALLNLITFDRTWLRPWAFYAIDDVETRNELLALFPEGCYVAFAGDAYCEARSESMDDHWRVLHALPGDGQNRPSVGDSLVQVQERYNVLSNMQAETYEYGIPPIYADPQVLDFDALANQVAEPAAHFPARARPGQPLAAGFFQPQPARVPPDMVQHQQELIGPVAQFLTGLFPAVFGGNMEDVKTASGYALARDQALGRLGLVWRRMKQFYADVILLGVDSFRKNRPEDVEIPLLGPDGVLDARTIRIADLKGNISVHPEADETFPRLKSQQRGILQQLFGVNDPVIQQALTEPANMGYIKNVLGLTELVVPGEDARNKQLREIQQLLASAPIVITMNESGATHAGAASDSAVVAQHAAPAQESPNDQITRASDSNAAGTRNQSPVTNHQSQVLVLPSVPVDDLLDNHAVEFEECKRWASSEAGQAARMTNPAGFANVRAHAEAHLRASNTTSALNLASLAPVLSQVRRDRTGPEVRPRELHTTSAAQRAPKPGDDHDGPGDHWVTIDGHHVLVHESQGTQKQPPNTAENASKRQTPESLASQIPAQVKAKMVQAINDSNAPTADDKRGGFHEEYGVAGLDASGNWVISRDKPGPYANPDVDTKVSPSYVPADPKAAYSIVNPEVAFHVHPAGTTGKGKGWNQPPSEADKSAVVPGQINLIFAARENKVYFYDNSGVIGKPMSLKDFLKE
ncbi:MAG TPA: hypothetical protein VOA78_11165 [Candidatus Dormibacteraeota bacterium]|nr:hypothetical protein [Candidatus Dormibacteraeota bacterium]